MSALKIWKGIRRYTLQPTPVQDKSEDNAPLLTALQCKTSYEALQRVGFLVNVMHVTGRGKNPQAQGGVDQAGPAATANAAPKEVPCT